ncbi:UDP-N-acetylmuramate:L-alanyl-gamma-D-glutamyl-meso-diaminopimelate ligase [Hydrogenophaga sp.]|uniref:UDP-N-acetylmuramate:L-alanyl-gamma-D-glutamyl- meso-diaminopimelate ligase n=1 Tax=Hydrogenophaga sp. TaxID=1904254 RepID=UPI00286DEAB1|nr:UDP-N-acetylmuramate:L-alanyl-gamma-D-glutamyl-meso-diaminopimelate ligase [Hydrogenophaga sp.]
MHIHILGICGTFMGGVAALAREAGHHVTGCDAGVYPPMSDQLRALGIELIEGFGADQMALQPDMYVVGNVVSRARLPDGTPKFPLMEAILEAGAPYTSGPQWLAEHVLQGRHVLAVAGTHGKTTTTSMLAWVLEANGLNPGFLVGGVPMNFGVSARLGGGAAVRSAPVKEEPAQRAGGTEQSAQPLRYPLFVIEADEYDTAFFDKRSKFVHYRPRTAILNNLEFDHADIFDDLKAIERQFHHLVRTVPGTGRVVVNGLEESLDRVLHAGCWSEVRSFGAAVSDFSAVGEPDAFDVLQRGQKVARVEWALTGVHNQLNALAAIAAAEHVGVAPADAARALGSFQNVRRRMEVRGSVARSGGGITVYDDFAHHPTAIRTTLDGLQRKLRASGDAGRILAVFEPRSNTMKLGTMKSQLPWSLEAADLAFCHSGGLDWDAAEALAPMGDRALVAGNIDALVQQVVAAARAGDHIVCMSNGGFGGIHGRLLGALQG